MKRFSATSRNKVPLIEAAIAAVVLVVSSVYIVSAYVKADSLKGKARSLSEAVIKCEDVAEKLHLSKKGPDKGAYETPFGMYEIGSDQKEIYRQGYDKDWLKVMEGPEYELVISAYAIEGDPSVLLKYTVTVMNDRKETLAELPSSCVVILGE